MDDKIKKKIWSMSEKIDGKDDTLYRKDKFGNTIYYHSFGKETDMGWTIAKKDGRKNIEQSNLQATKIKKSSKKSSK